VDATQQGGSREFPFAHLAELKVDTDIRAKQRARSSDEFER